MAEKKTEKEPEVKNPWLKENLNLTEQARILKADPKLAAKMKAQAATAEQVRQNNAEQKPELPKSLPVVNANRKRRKISWLP